MAPEDPVENAGEMSRMVEEPPAHHHARRVHADHSLQQEHLTFCFIWASLVLKNSCRLA